MKRVQLLTCLIAPLIAALVCFSPHDAARHNTALRSEGEVSPSPVEVPVDLGIGLYAVQSTSNWNLDITDGVMDGAYSYPDGATGSGVDVYVVDTGVYVAHTEFGGRAIEGKDYASSEPCDYQGVTYTEWDGHGTHVAGTIGSGTFGIAKGVRIINVRVLDNCGYGDTDVATTALRWIIRHHKASRVGIVNMSFGAPADQSTVTLERAVADLLGDNLIPVVAAGNESSDACGSSPANVASALTVGAARWDATSSSVKMAGYSNYGTCVDLLAPGSNILSTWNYYRPRAWTATISGTSMATPLVSGIAALVAQKYPRRCATSVRDAVVASASSSFNIGNLVGATPDLLAQLNLDVVPALSPPGNVTMVIPVATASRTVTVGWDRPCSGGSPIIDYTMRVYEDGNLVDTATLPGSINSIVVHNVVNGAGYSFDLTARNALGNSAVISARSRAAIAAPMRVGATSARMITDVVGVAFPSQVTVESSSASVCEKVYASGWKLLGLAKGTCTIRVRPLGAGYSYTRSISVT